MSLSEYIRRRKMTQAAFELQRTDSKGIDIALKYAELPDIKVYPICDSQPVHGHSEVWIAIKKEDR